MQENQPLIFQKNYYPLLKKILVEYQTKEGNLLPILHRIQDELGFIPSSLISPLADALNLSAAEIHGVISFYTHYRTEMPSKVIIEICQAESCKSMGALNLKKELLTYLKDNGLDVQVDNIYCLGLCAQSPAAMINNKPIAKLTLDKLITPIKRALT
ncbi:formate dehydrogenase [Oligella urethralis]|uniref:NAD(P)H-dependent oxidoreductase subunit E n=1 Tax=Oligella urethralis TaxID=90245 RepID=UPI000CFF5245|nr:NAD(P)H-dependent oxidoreductase subunit E [Oligella urethralis]AVL71403.1 formate dehydrogenase [Oligella urethralis]